MLKTLFAFIIGFQTLIGVNSSAGLNTQSPPTYESRPVAQIAEPLLSTVKREKDADYIKKLTSMGITLHPGKEYAADSTENPVNLNRCASLVYRTLQIVPGDVGKKVKNLTLYFNSSGRRGLGGGSTIILRCQNVSDAELVSVLVHELGHIKDTGLLQGNVWAGESEFMDGKNPIYQDDPSLDFYRISFKNDKTLRSGISELDFISGYAKSDPFEDFAETFNFFLLHGDNFREMTKNNSALKKKYDFMKNVVFDGQEFDFESEQSEGLEKSRNYDSTLIGYNLEKFLAI